MGSKGYAPVVGGVLVRIEHEEEGDDDKTVGGHLEPYYEVGQDEEEEEPFVVGSYTRAILSGLDEEP